MSGLVMERMMMRLLEGQDDDAKVWVVWLLGEESWCSLHTGGGCCLWWSRSVELSTMGTG